MLRYYKYYFIRIYNWYYREWGAKEFPAQTAAIMISIPITFYFMFILLTLRYFGVNTLLNDKVVIYLTLIISGAVLLVNSFIFMHKEKYKIIEKEYSLLSKRMKTNVKYFGWFYHIISYLLPFIYVII